MNDASRNQGWAICLGAGFLAFLFLVGILNESYWAIAIPVKLNFRKSIQSSTNTTRRPMATALGASRLKIRRNSST